MDPILRTVAIYLSLWLVLLVTIIFEKLHHAVSHRLHKDVPILSIIEERSMLNLASLGFASLGLFTINRHGFTKYVNDLVWGKDIVETVAEEELAHHGEPIELAPTQMSTEIQSVYYVVFFSFLTFVVLTYFLVHHARTTYDAWKKRFSGTAHQPDPMFDKALYRFRNPRSTLFVPQRPYALDYNFAQYLGQIQGDLIACLVSFEKRVWLWLIFVVISLSPVLEFAKLAVFRLLFTFSSSIYLIVATVILRMTAKDALIKLTGSLGNDEVFTVSKDGVVSSFESRLLPLGNRYYKIWPRLCQLTFIAYLLLMAILTRDCTNKTFAYELEEESGFPNKIAWLLPLILLAFLATSLLLGLAPAMRFFSLSTSLEFQQDPSRFAAVDRWSQRQVLEKFDTMKVNARLILQFDDALTPPPPSDSELQTARELFSLISRDGVAMTHNRIRLAIRSLDLLTDHESDVVLSDLDEKNGSVSDAITFHRFVTAYLLGHSDDRITEEVVLGLVFDKLSGVSELIIPANLTRMVLGVTFSSTEASNLCQMMRSGPNGISRATFLSWASGPSSVAAPKGRKPMMTRFHKHS